MIVVVMVNIVVMNLTNYNLRYGIGNMSTDNICLSDVGYNVLQIIIFNSNIDDFEKRQLGKAVLTMKRQLEDVASLTKRLDDYGDEGYVKEQLIEILTRHR